MAMAANTKRILLWSVPSVLLAAALLWALTPKPVPVDLVEVEQAPLTVTVEGEGRTRVRDVYVVSAPVSGRMERIAVDVGDDVVSGEPVVSIRPADPGFLDVRAIAAAVADVRAAEAAVAMAQAEVERASSSLDFAQAELNRAERLAQQGTISPRTLEKTEADFLSAEAALAATRQNLGAQEAALEAARARLIQPGPASISTGNECCLRVIAPTSGTILRVMQESETIVQAGQPILEIGNPRDLEVVTDLLSSDAVRVRPGMPVTLEDWGGAYLRGVVRRVAPSGFTKVSALGIEEQRVNVYIDPAEGSWPEALGDGFRILARIAIWHTDETLVVPLGAVFRVGDDWAVLRVEEEVAQRRIIDLGRTNGLIAQVEDGLAAGDLVVLHPSDRVSNGTPIVPRETVQ